MVQEKAKQTKAGKSRSRIPGVWVGDVVNTSKGPKKKICFNIGGRWFWRMVDPSWKAPGRPPLGKAKGGGAKGHGKARKVIKQIRHKGGSA